MGEFRNLSFLLDPRSIAIVGASPKSGWPARIWANLRRFGYDGKIYLVNPRYETLWGQRCYASMDELPEVVDNALIIVPAPRAIEMLDRSPSPRFRAATIFSGGFGEGGDPEGLKRKEFLRAYARERGVHFCGPNCMGLVSTGSRAMLFPDERLSSLGQGGLAIVSQSGGLVGSLVRTCASRSIGLSYFVSSGNEADAEVSDYLGYFIRDSRTRVIGAFIEGVQAGEKFVAAATEALAVGKPIIVLKIGRSAKGAEAALAHTGALAGNDRVFDAVCLENGLLRVGDLDQLLNTAELFLNLNRLPQGKRAAFVTFSGGLRGLLSDLAQEAELELPRLRPQTEAELGKLLDVGASVGNPLDTGWGGLSSQETYLKCIRLLLEDPEVDLLAVQEELPQSDVRPDKESNLLALAGLARESHKPIAVFSAITQSITDYGRQFKERCPLPFLQGANNTVRALKLLGPYGGAARNEGRRDKKSRALRPLGQETREKLAGKRILNEWESYQILSDYGFSLPGISLATDLEEALRAAEQIGYPVALKLVAPGVAHKTELGGIRLNLGGPEEVESAWSEMERAYRARGPAASPAGFLVQEMVQGGLETIIGAVNDRQFGPAVMFGLGGKSVELFRDVTFRMAPVGLEEAKAMISSIKGYPLLAGFRGSPPLDQEALCQAIVLLSEFAVAGADLIQSVDLNPFIVLERAGKIADAAIVTRAGAE